MQEPRSAARIPRASFDESQLYHSVLGQRDKSVLAATTGSTTASERVVWFDELELTCT